MFLQALKFHTLAITIYCYHNLDLAVPIDKLVQDILDTTKNENHILLKTEDLEKKSIFHDNNSWKY